MGSTTEAVAASAPAVFPRHSQAVGAVTSVDMTMDGMYLLASSRHGPVRTWDVRMGRPLLRYKVSWHSSSSGSGGRVPVKAPFSASEPYPFMFVFSFFSLFRFVCGFCWRVQTTCRMARMGELIFDALIQWYPLFNDGGLRCAQLYVWST